MVCSKRLRHEAEELLTKHSIQLKAATNNAHEKIPQRPLIAGSSSQLTYRTDKDGPPCSSHLFSCCGESPRRRGRLSHPPTLV